jgi:hypothetical protein
MSQIHNNSQKGKAANSSLACQALSIVFQHVWIPKLGWDVKILEERLPIINETIAKRQLQLLKSSPTNTSFNEYEVKTKFLTLLNQPTGYFSDDFINLLTEDRYEIKNSWLDQFEVMEVSC